jgi:hypothetical protein
LYPSLKSSLRYITLVLCLVVVGCTAEPLPELTPTALPQSAWGSIYTITFAPHVDAPAFTLNNDQLAFAWIGSDQAGVHQDVRTLSRDGLSEAASLPLNPFAPHSLTVWSAMSGSNQLLYLDQDSASQTYRLYSAVFTAPHTLVRGPTLVSDQTTARYSVVADVTGNLQVVWSTGIPLESRLYQQRIDASGRPQQSSLLTVDADYPALATTPDGTVTLFWLEPNTNLVYRAELSEGALQDVQALGPGLVRQPGELLLRFSVEWTASGFLLLWNTLLPNASPRVYGSIFPADAPSIPMVLPLSIDQAGMTQPLSWLSTHSTDSGLIAAAGVGDELGILQWDGQAFTDFEPIVTLESPLIGFPQLIIDQEDNFYLAWAEPRNETTAELRFTMTRLLDSLNPL